MPIRSLDQEVRNFLQKLTDQEREFLHILLSFAGTTAILRRALNTPNHVLPIKVYRAYLQRLAQMLRDHGWSEREIAAALENEQRDKGGDL